jgi:hypothetical protein
VALDEDVTAEDALLTLPLPLPLPLLLLYIMPLFDKLPTSAVFVFVFVFVLVLVFVFVFVLGLPYFTNAAHALPQAFAVASNAVLRAPLPSNSAGMSWRLPKSGSRSQL